MLPPLRSLRRVDSGLTIQEEEQDEKAQQQTAEINESVDNLEDLTPILNEKAEIVYNSYPSVLAIAIVGAVLLEYTEYYISLSN